MRKIIESAKALWNSQADEHNQWAALGEDERLELVAKEAERQALERAALRVEQMIDSMDTIIGADAQAFVKLYQRMAANIRALKDKP